jgi:hypothetical protein
MFFLACWKGLVSNTSPRGQNICLKWAVAVFGSHHPASAELTFPEASGAAFALAGVAGVLGDLALFFPLGLVAIANCRVIIHNGLNLI